MLTTMDDKQCLGNKITRKTNVNFKNKKVTENPLKKCHFLEGKYFVVIDNLIIEKLHFIDSEVNELYFQEELSSDGCIILRPFKMEA